MGIDTRTRTFINRIAAAAVVALLWVPLVQAEHNDDRTRAFSAAADVPADVDLYVRLRNARHLRSALADRPIMQWVDTMLTQGDFHQAWANLADAAGIKETRLFDGILGYDASLAVRYAADQTQWALRLRAPQRKSEPVLSRLKLQLQPPRHRFRVQALPEQQVIIADRDDLILVGPSQAPALLYEMLERIDAAGPETDDHASSLLKTDALQRASELGPGQIAVFVRHTALIGGWSAAVANLDGDRLDIQHTGHFDAPPFKGDVTAFEIDIAPLASFEHNAMLAVMTPTDTADNPVNAFMQARLGVPLVDDEVRQNLGEAQIIAVGEQEGRLEADRVDIMLPTIALCLETKDDDGAVEMLDNQMARVTARLSDMSKGQFLVETPDLTRLGRRDARHVDLGEAANWFGGGFPIMRNVSLNWTVTRRPDGPTYLVIASHPQQLEATVAALSTPVDPGRQHAKLASAGIANGLQIGNHLLSYREQADAIVEEPFADEFRETLTMLAQLAGGMERVRWQLARPGRNDVRLNVQVELARDPSARSSAPESRDDDCDKRCPSQ